MKETFRGNARALSHNLCCKDCYYNTTELLNELEYEIIMRNFMRLNINDLKSNPENEFTIKNKVILIDEPYVSDCLINFIVKNKIPVLVNDFSIKLKG